ncbi:glycosyltransferase involved in cell wall biosynthesis [Bacillus ectoiniformans]|nr:glycosyltransferase involved in cell wall biosynthesis [Bacillus ectoiniformans]
MRNEERNVKDCIESIQALTYPHWECIIIDDQSNDQTPALLKKYTESDSRFTVIQGRPLPKDWVGKVHACDQLSEAANGDYLLFLDADVRIKPNTIQQALFVMKRHQSGLVTGFAHFPVHTWLAKLLVPLQTFIVFFHLPVLVANYTLFPASTAAHGGFMFFECKAYRHMGGHQKVKDSLVEDIHIAREMKKSGKRVTLTNISPSVACYMYETNEEVWKGFLKNIYAGLGRSPLMAAAAAVFYFSFYVLPFILAIAGLALHDWLYLAPLVITYLQVFAVDAASNQSKWHFIYMPFSAAALIILMFASMKQSHTGKGYEWKGRKYV